MGAVQRKDYAEDAIVSPGNEVIKRVNQMNAPHSFQGVGLTNRPDLHIPCTEEGLEKLQSGYRVLAGNKEGYITSLTKDEETDEEGGIISSVLATVTIVFDIDDVIQEETYTKDELLRHPTYFFTKI